MLLCLIICLYLTKHGQKSCLDDSVNAIRFCTRDHIDLTDYNGLHRDVTQVAMCKAFASKHDLGNLRKICKYFIRVYISL